MISNCTTTDNYCLLQKSIKYFNLTAMKQILACCFALITCRSFCQIQTEKLSIDAVIDFSLPKDSTELASKINISRLTILDSRDDTSSLGYFVSPIGETKKYEFRSGFEKELSDWYSAYLKINEQNKTGTCLLVNVKKLRLSDEVTPRIYENGHVGQPNEGWEKGVIIKIEYFLQKDSLFTPLYRFDSVIVLKERLRSNAHDYISTALQTSLVKLFAINLDAALYSKNKILLSDIIRVNRHGHDLPIYISTKKQKGVYATFNEFKMNAPSLADYEFRKGKMGDILYIKENSSEYPARNVWGYCDGENFFINSGDKYSRLVRTGYSFYFQGIKAITRKAVHKWLQSSGLNYATDTGPKKTTFKKKLKYYQVDMETGEAY